MVPQLSEDGAHRKILWPETTSRLVTFEVRRIWAFEKAVCYESQLAGSLLSANKVSIRGSGGRACPSGPKSRYYLGGRVCFGSVFPGHVPCGKRVTVGYRFPLGPHFGEPFGVLGRGADVCEKGEGVLAQIGKVRVKAPFATAVDVGGGRTKVARLEGLCRAL